MPEVRMPRLSDSMEEATIVRWLKAEGDDVRQGEELVEIDTDKATVAYEAECDGKLTILAAQGATVALGDPIALIGDVVEPAPAERVTTGAAAAGVVAGAATTAPTRQAAKNGAVERAAASPLARRIAATYGIDLTELEGSGVRGRIVKADVEAAVSSRRDSGSRPAQGGGDLASEGPAVARSAKGHAVVIEPTRLQQTVTRRMAQTKATVPEFTVGVDVDMEALVAFRAQLKQDAPDQPATPSYNDFIVKACALALRNHRRANGAYEDGRFELYERINIGIAVSSEDALVVPVIQDADRKSVGAIAAEARSLAAKVRDGSISPAEVASGTFTISNLGMFGADRFTAVINSPQAAILAVGAMAVRPAVIDGAVVGRNMLALTLTCDHRILYGTHAAQFLSDVRKNLEQPLRLAF